MSAKKNKKAKARAERAKKSDAGATKSASSAGATKSASSASATKSAISAGATKSASSASAEASTRGGGAARASDRPKPAKTSTGRAPAARAANDAKRAASSDEPRSRDTAEPRGSEDRWAGATPVTNAETRVPRARPSPRPPVRLEPSSAGQVAAPTENAPDEIAEPPAPPPPVDVQTPAPTPRRARALAPRSRASSAAPIARSATRARISARAVPVETPPRAPEPPAEPDAIAPEAPEPVEPRAPEPAIEVAAGDALYAVEETIDRFLGPATPASDRDSRRRAAEAFAQVAAHLGGHGETSPEEAASDALRPGYYVRQWGRLGLRGRADDVDELGLDPAYEARHRPLLDGLYRRWFRAHARGLENVPATGRVLLVANHGGALPWDGLVLRTAFRLEHPTQRDVRWLAEDSVAHAPFLGAITNRLGAVRACPENGERLLAQERAVAVFPEGEKGAGKRFKDRYALQRFGRGGYVRLALRMRAPIVPTAIVGSEEAHPLLFRASALAKLIGMPYLPITPTFPWLGPLGLVPLPSRWVILCGEPIDLDRADPDDPIAVAHINDRVRGAVQALVNRALELRGKPF